MHIVINILMFHCNLHTLTLHHNRFGNMGTIFLSTFLKTNSSLQNIK
jgi:hypothetical protein